MEEPESVDPDEIMAYLFDIGAMVPSGMEGDEMTYQWVDDIELMAIDPDLIEIKRAFMKLVYKEIEDSLIDMFDEGLVDMDIDDELQTVWTITEKGREVFRDVDEQ
jgi:hypothetical protein